MYKYFIYVLLITLYGCSAAKSTVSDLGNEKPYKKINVILLGVWHFNPNSTNDSKKINTDILSPKNQKELEEVRTILARHNPNKIFIEFDNGQEGQSFLDSMYIDFLDNEEFDYAHPPYTTGGLDKFKRTEHFQLSFKLAKQLGLKKVYAADHYASVSMKPVNDWKKNGGGTINKSFFNTSIPVDYPNFDSLLTVKSIKDILLYLNSESAKKLLQDEYFSFNLKYGDEKNYPGVDYALNWHKRNMRIYNNILRELDFKTDDTILVIFAGSHTSILQDYFNNSLYFNVISTEKVLNQKKKSN